MNFIFISIFYFFLLQFNSTFFNSVFLASNVIAAILANESVKQDSFNLITHSHPFHLSSHEHGLYQRTVQHDTSSHSSQ